jgi:anti-anti-sigma factor
MCLAVRRGTQGASAPYPSPTGDRLRVGITMTTPLATSVHAPSITSHRGGPRPSRTARVDYRLLTPTVVVIGVHGEIDASNAGILDEHVAEHATRCDGVILDLGGLEFCGIEGFPALHRVSVSCARTGIRWAVVPGPAVSRLLRICDPEGSLPVAGSVDAAIAIATAACPDLPLVDIGALMNIAAPGLGVIPDLSGGPRSSDNARSARPEVE